MQRPQLQKKVDLFFSGLDPWILIPVLMMTMIGLVVLNRVLMAGYAGVWPANFIKQLGSVLVGLLLALTLCLLDSPTLHLVGWAAYALSILLLIYVKIDGFSLAAETGADSWMRLPIVGTFQPSELAKIGIAVVGADYFARMKEGKISYLNGFTSLAAIYGIPLFLILREPDFGTSMVIVMMFLLTIFVFGIQWKYIFLFGGLALAAFPLVWKFYFSPYMRQRILTLVFPSHELTDDYHIAQALKAIASGGVIGNQSGVDVHVPVKESDFIFTAVSEYLGLIGSALLILLVVIFLGRSIYVAAKISQVDVEFSYMMIALIASLSFHFIENMGMNVGLLPITGIPLPFVSMGGTSMLMNYFALGLMLNASLNLKVYHS